MADITKKSNEETSSSANIAVQHGPGDSDTSTDQHMDEKNTATELK
jgi:hypothetical protein